MCSILEEGELKPQETQNSHLQKSCMKCGNPPVVTIRVKDPLCKECFMAHCVHKFRVSFGKSKLIRDQEKVLVAFSGGHSSSAMLHLIQEGKSERAQRKLRFVPSVVFIDESSLFQMDSVTETDNIIKIMKRTGYVCTVYKLSQVLANDISPVFHSDFLHKNQPDTGELDLLLKKCRITDCYDTELLTIFDQAKSLTAKQSLLLNMRMQFLHNIALRSDCTKVLIADSCTRLAVHMLSDITQGRGGQLSYEMSFADTRRQEVTFVRPMREFSNKEIAMYNALNNIETVFLENFSTKAAGSSSLDRLTEDFVTGLQADFPNTVSTIFRTGEKLDAVEKNPDQLEMSCCMCQAPLDTDVGVSSALNATLFSRKLCSTRLGPDQQLGNNQTDTSECGNRVEDDNRESCCGQGDGSCHISSNRMSLDELYSCLCYGCRLIIKDMKDYSKIPSYILKAAEKHICRLKMKDSIQDFLL